MLTTQTPTIDPGRISAGCLAILLSLVAARPALGAWGDGAWPFRRAVDVEWNDKSKGDELAVVDIITCGKHEASGEAVRVMTEDNKLVPSRVLMSGPGDRMRVLFSPMRNVRRHYVYFGCPKPPAPPRNTGDVPIRTGVLMEMRKMEGAIAANAQQVQAAWSKAGKVIGRTMLPGLYIGFNPFGHDHHIMCSYTATLNVPVDGTYSFAGSVSDRGALFIDGKLALFIPGLVGDVRQAASVELKRGPHDLVLYQQNVGGTQRISVVWKRPDSTRYELLQGAPFGTLVRATPGTLEDKDKMFNADMKVEYLGECFFADHYSHRYRFTAQVTAPAKTNVPLTVNWDFGDGQTATGPMVEHVFLTEEEYPVKISAKWGQHNDVRVNRLAVSRLYERIDNPPGDMPSIHGKIVATYDVDKMPANWLPWASSLLERAKEHAVLEKVAVRLAASRQIDAGIGMNTLGAAAFELMSAGKLESAARIWQTVPADSPFQPFAVQCYGELLIWRMADFAKAIQVLEPFAKKAGNKNRTLQRLYAYALILGSKGAEGIPLLKSIGGDGQADRHSALTGAEARTIEFYIGQGDWETGEHIWEKWARQYPADFLEGYSVLLRTRLMELAKTPEAAAKVAEAFALAVPKSSYAPRLLDRASKLMEPLNPNKSKSLRETLKQKYPEDPLSQDKQP